MDILPKKQKIFYTLLVAIEVSLVSIFKGGIEVLFLCFVSNVFAFGISCWKSTEEFIELLRSENPIIYHKHQWAMDSQNILTIRLVLRKEVLDNKESKNMKLALKYARMPFIIDIALIAIFIISRYFC